MQDVSRRTQQSKTQAGGPRPRPGIGRIEGPDGMTTRAPGDDNPTSHASGSRPAVVRDVAQECIITSPGITSLEFYRILREFQENKPAPRPPGADRHPANLKCKTYYMFYRRRVQEGLR